VRVVVIGHVEWVEFARVPELPRPGEIVHATGTWEEAAGGGAVAAVQLAKLAGDATLFTALGEDELGERSLRQLRGQGVHVQAARPESQTRRAFTHVDEGGERTITVLGAKLVPRLAHSLAWEELERADGVYFVSGDAALLRSARRARVLVATARELPTVVEAGIELDALVGSANDVGETFKPGDVDPPPKLAVWTSGKAGGWSNPGGPYSAAPLPGPVEDAYGCGDAFAAGLTFALARGDKPRDAIGLAARCGAAALTGRGGYAGQLRLDAAERGG
jgi:ribokinase